MKDKEQKSDILLVNPPEVFRKGGISANLALHHPSGVMAVAAILRKEGINVSIIDALADSSAIEDIVNVIKTIKPKILGISATSPQIRGAYQLAFEVKRAIGSDATIALGGAHITADPDFYNRFSDIFDLAIVGEAEITFVELVKKVIEGEKITGLYHGKITEDLDSLPYSARDLIRRDSYCHMPYKSNFVLINSIRGCPYQCSFCSNPVFGKKIRYRSVDSVIHEIKYCLEKYNTKYVSFADDTLTLNKNRIIDLCERILDENIKIKWGGGTRANLVDEKLLRLMYRAGCRDIAYGIETGNEELRAKIVKKGVKREDIINAFRISRKIGFETGALCMLGFPGETIEMMEETLKLVMEINAHLFGFHITVLMPGSELYNIALKEGKIEKDIWDKYARGEAAEQPVYVPDGFTIDDLKKIQMDAYHKYYFRPSYLIDKFLMDIRSFSKLANNAKIGLNLLFFRKTGTGRV